MTDNEEEIRVSTVIPAYNAEACIGRAIDSVLGQALSVHEIIVVDDGSSDGTGNAVQKYGEKVVYIRQNNAGVSVARNTGIKAATGNWIAFLDADDEWLYEKNLKQVNVIKLNPDLRWCAANYFRAIGKDKKPLGSQKAIQPSLQGKQYFENYFKATIKDVCHAHTQTMMIRKDVFDEIGGFEPGKKRHQDLDVWWHIGYRYPKIGYIAEPLAVMHLEEHDPRLVKFRLEEKKGEFFRKLVAKHLSIAKDFGMRELFGEFARKQLLKRVKSMLYNGFGEDAKKTVRQFGYLFPKWICWGIYLLAVFPKATAAGMRGISWVKHVTKLNRQVTRRYSQTEIENQVKQ